MPTRLKSQQAFQSSGWERLPGTLTYASATTINSSVDLTGVLQKGDKLKLNNTSTKYFYVVSLTSSVITVTGGSDYTVANSAITAPFFSKVESPQGFPLYFSYTPTVTSSTGTLTTKSATGVFSIHHGTVTAIIAVSITDKGTGDGGIVATLPVNSAQGGTAVGRETLVNGFLCSGSFFTTSISILKYDNTSIIANGISIPMTVIYFI